MKEVITNNEIPLDILSDKLLEIHDNLDKIAFFDKNTLTPEIIDQIQESLDKLSADAKIAGLSGKAEALKRISLQFYLLNTVGVADNQDKFSKESTHAFEMLELFLLTIDDASPKNKGLITEKIEARNFQE